MNSRNGDGGADLIILVLALAALAGVLTFAMITGNSEGPEPIPLPTAPTTTEGL